MECTFGSLLLSPESITNREIITGVGDLPDPEPGNPAVLDRGTPLMKRLWRTALADIESNIIEEEGRRYFGAGAVFKKRMYLRDIAYSGVLGLNRFYPDLVFESIKAVLNVHSSLGFTVSRNFSVPEIKAGWREEDIHELEFIDTYRVNSYTHRTDEVVWLWCMGDLLAEGGTSEQWKWLYETGHACFDTFYHPFFDPDDGLYRGQASFIDIHSAYNKGTAYPQEWKTADCVLLKALSTNCLYLKGFKIMAEACSRVGKNAEAENWKEKADALKKSIIRELRFPDGTFAYFKDRHGKREPRRECLGTALAVLFRIVEQEEAEAALRDYPITDAGIPLLEPFYPNDLFYHNNSAWPFAETFFIKGLEQSDGKDRTPLNAALLARSCTSEGTFCEVIDYRTGHVRQKASSQLWTAAAFLDTCVRGGLTAPSV